MSRRPRLFSGRGTVRAPVKVLVQVLIAALSGVALPGLETTLAADSSSSKATSKPDVTAPPTLRSLNLRVDPAPGTGIADRWTLSLAGRPIGSLETIGGRPEFSEPVALEATSEGRQVLVLPYTAGAAGTRVITYLSRLLVLSKGPQDSSYQISLDIAVELDRFQGEQLLYKATRTLKWGPHSSSLQVGPLDESPETSYSWKQGLLVPSK